MSSSQGDFLGNDNLGRRPVPAVNHDSRFFWEGAQRDTLLIQRCSACEILHCPAHTLLSAMPVSRLGQRRSLWAGTVLSFVVHHHPPVTGFAAPFIIAVVELDEGTRFVTNLVDILPSDVRVGDRVQVMYAEVSDGFKLPVFAPCQIRGG